MKIETLAKTPAPKLLRYDAMCKAIAACRSVDETKEIRRKAIALAAYAKQAVNRENERKCIEIRIRAERRTGELLREAVTNGTRAKQGQGSKGRTPPPLETLGNLGIKKDQSADWQQLASIPSKVFEAELRKDGPLSTDQILISTGKKKIHQPSPIENVSYDALDVHGWLKEIEREKFLERTPEELLETMLPHMIEDIARLGPVVIEWLKLLTEEATKCLNTTVQNG